MLVEIELLFVSLGLGEICKVFVQDDYGTMFVLVSVHNNKSKRIQKPLSC